MKKCEYCAKQIGYHDMYCSDECQKSANDFYDMRDKYLKPFSIINGVFVLAVGICIFLYSFMHDVGIIGGSVSLIILGLMYILLPFPADVMIEKLKLKKAINITRYIGIGMLVIGAAVLTLFIIGII